MFSDVFSKSFMFEVLVQTNNKMTDKYQKTTSHVTVTPRTIRYLIITHTN